MIYKHHSCNDSQMYDEDEPRTCRNCSRENIKQRSNQFSAPCVYDSAVYPTFGHDLAIWQKGYQTARDVVSFTGNNENGVLDLIKKEPTKQEKMKKAQEETKDFAEGKLISVGTKIAIFMDSTVKDAAQKLQTASKKAALNSDKFAEQYQARTECHSTGTDGPYMTRHSCRKVWPYDPTNNWMEWTPFVQSPLERFRDIMATDQDVQAKLVFSGANKDSMETREDLIQYTAMAYDKLNLDKAIYARKADELVGTDVMLDMDRMIRSGLADIVPRKDIIEDKEGKYHEILNDTQDTKYALVIEKDITRIKVVREATLAIMTDLIQMAEKQEKSAAEMIMGLIKFKKWNIFIQSNEAIQNNEIESNNFQMTTGVTESTQTREYDNDAYFTSLQQEADNIINLYIEKYKLNSKVNDSDKLKTMIYKSLSTLAQWNVAVAELGVNFIEISSENLIDTIWLGENPEYFSVIRRVNKYREHRAEGKKLIKKYMDDQFISTVDAKTEILKERLQQFRKKQQIQTENEMKRIQAENEMKRIQAENEMKRIQAENEMKRIQAENEMKRTQEKKEMKRSKQMKEKEEKQRTKSRIEKEKQDIGAELIVYQPPLPWRSSDNDPVRSNDAHEDNEYGAASSQHSLRWRSSENDPVRSNDAQKDNEDGAAPSQPLNVLEKLQKVWAVGTALTNHKKMDEIRASSNDMLARLDESQENRWAEYIQNLLRDIPLKYVICSGLGAGTIAGIFVLAAPHLGMMITIFQYAFPVLKQAAYVFGYVPCLLIWKFLTGAGSLLSFLIFQGGRLTVNMIIDLIQRLSAYVDSLKRQFGVQSHDMPALRIPAPTRVWNKVKTHIQHAQRQITILLNTSIPEESRQIQIHGIVHDLDQRTQSYLEYEDSRILYDNQDHVFVPNEDEEDIVFFPNEDEEDNVFVPNENEEDIMFLLED